LVDLIVITDKSKDLRERGGLVSAIELFNYNNAQVKRLAREGVSRGEIFNYNNAQVKRLARVG